MADEKETSVFGIEMFEVKDKTKTIIDSIWCSDYYIVAARESAPSKKDVMTFAAKYDVKLPREYIAHVTGFFGSPYLEVKEEFWPRHKEFDVGPFWSFLYGLFVYAYSDEAPDWMNIKIATEEFQAMGHKVIPILKIIGDADVYCLNKKGEIQRYSHEEDTFEAFDGGFFDLLQYEFLELDERRTKKKAELAKK